MAVGQDHHLAGSHDGADADGESVSGHVLGLAAEETAVGDAGVCRQCLHTGLGTQ